MSFGMEDDLGLTVSIRVMSVTVGALVEHSSNADTMRFMYEEISTRGLIYNTGSYNVLIRSLTGMREGVEARSFVRRMKEDRITV